MPGPIHSNGPAGGYAATSGVVSTAAGLLTPPGAPRDYPPSAWVQPTGRTPAVLPNRSITRYQSFNGLTDGSSFTTTLSAATGDPVGFVSFPTGGFVAATTDNPYRGTSSVRFSAQGTAGTAYAEWGTAGQPLGVAGQYPINVRLRFRCPFMPADSTGIPFLVIVDNAGAFQVDVRVNNTGNIILRSGAGVVQATSTTTVASNTWADVAVRAARFDTSAGTFSVDIYNTTTGAVVETLTASGIDTLRGGGAQRVQFGTLRSIANSTIDINEIAVSSFTVPDLPSSTGGQAQVVEAGGTSVVTGNTATVSTGSFTPGSNTLLVATCAMGNGTAVASSLGAVTDSLGGSWTRLAGAASAAGGVAEVWARDIATAAPMTVTYDPGGAGASGLAVRVAWYTGARPAAQQPLQAATTPAGGVDYSIDVTPVGTGSYLLGALGRATDSQTVAAYTGTTALGGIIGTGGDVAAIFRSTVTTTAAQLIKLGYSNTPGGANYLAVAEIGTTAPGSTVTATTAAATAAVPAPGVTVAAVPAPAAVAGTAAVAKPVMLLSTLVDNFSNNVVDVPPWVNSYGGVTEVGGRARVPCTSATYAGYQTGTDYSFDQFLIEVPTLPVKSTAVVECYAATWVFSAAQDPGTHVGFQFDLMSNNLSFMIRAGYVDAGAVSVTIDPVLHRWLRLTLTGGNLVWETSPDGAAWTARRTASAPAWLAPARDCKLLLEAHRDAGAADYVEFDNLNLAPSVAATPAPATAALTAAAGSPTVTGGGTALPATVSATAGVAAPTVRLGALPSPAATAAVASVSAPTVSGAGLVAPATVAGFAAVPAAAAQAASAAAPPTAVAVASVPAATVRLGALPAPAAVAATAAVPAPTARVSVLPAPPVVAAAAAVPGPAVSGTGQAAPATVEGAATVPAPSVQTSSAGTATPAAVNATVSVSGAAATGSTTAPAAVAATAAVAAPTVRLSVLPTPTVVAAVAAVPAATVAAGSSPAPAVVAAAASVGAPAVATGNGAAPATVPATAAVPAAAAQTGTRPAPGTVAATTAVGAPSVGAATAAQPATAVVVAVVPSPLLRTGAAPAPVAAAAVAAVPVAAPRAASTALPATVAASTSAPAANVTSLAFAQPATAAALAAVAAAAVRVGAVARPATVDAVTGIPGVSHTVGQVETSTGSGTVTGEPIRAAVTGEPLRWKVTSAPVAARITSTGPAATVTGDNRRGAVT